MGKPTSRNVSRSGKQANKTRSKPGKRGTLPHNANGNGTVGIGTLKPDPRNARRHTPRNVGAIVDALHQVGAARSIVIDETNTILAGNATVEAAGEAGIERVKVVEADGNTLVAVRRTGLTAKQKAQLAILDNRSAELAEWDGPQLESLVDDFGLELKDIAFDDVEFKAALDFDEPPVAEDEVPTDIEPVCKPGDLWLLGEHRLLCGDSTKAEDVGRLLDGRTPFIMVTDPPYGVEYDPNWRVDAAATGSIKYGATRIGTVENDERSDWSEAWKLFAGDVVYVWHASPFVGATQVQLADSGFFSRALIVWRKPHLQISRGHYHWQHETCWYAVKKGSTAKWCGDRTQTTVWDIAFVQGGKDATHHGTQKPVECMARPIRNHGGRDDDVYDPFLGSGTTIIAAEQLGRRCYGLEISPKYCDVILARWEKLTGKTAERI